MRLYSFVNYYLSSLQHGLQTAHCVSEMSRRYKVNTTQKEMYDTWADDHKTIIILNGGNSKQLAELHDTLQNYGTMFSLPVVKFEEDEQSLNNALTSVAVVVPEKFYQVKFVRADERGIAGPYNDAYEYTDETGQILHARYEAGSSEFEFIKLLKSFRLA